MRPSLQGWEIHSEQRERNLQGRRAHNPQHAPACVIHSGVSHVIYSEHREHTRHSGAAAYGCNFKCA